MVRELFLSTLVLFSVANFAYAQVAKHLGLWEESHAPPDRGPPEKEITF